MSPASTASISVGGRSASASSIAAEIPATPSPPGPRWIAISGSSFGAVQPSTETSPPGAIRVASVRKPTTGPVVPTFDIATSVPKASFQPIGVAPSAISSARRVSSFSIPATTRGSSQGSRRSAISEVVGHPGAPDRGFRGRRDRAGLVEDVVAALEGEAADPLAIGAEQLAPLFHHPAGNEDRVDDARVGVVDDRAVGVVGREHPVGLGAEQDHVGLLARGEGADAVAETAGARPVDGREFDYFTAREWHMVEWLPTFRCFRVIKSPLYADQ